MSRIFSKNFGYLESLRVVYCMRSRIHTIGKEELIKIATTASSYADICRKCGLSSGHSVVQTVKKALGDFSIPLPSFGKLVPKILSDEELFVKNGKSCFAAVRNRILKKNLLHHECVKCKNTGEWMGEQITLQLDHIDGDRSNNQLSNLRWLCPNCHSQTGTYGAKNRKKISKTSPQCIVCGAKTRGHGFACKKCSNSIKTRRKNKDLDKPSIIWPSKDELEKLIWEIPITEIAKRLDCTPSNVCYFCKKNNIQQPKAGYWSMIKAGISHNDAMLKLESKNPKPTRLSEEEKNIINKMKEEDRSAYAIGIAINRPTKTVIRFLNKTLQLLS